MGAGDSKLHGLRLTLRHQIILVAYFGVLSAILSRWLHQPEADAGLAVLGTVLLVSPWVLGGLIVVLDRPGPLRDWQAAAVLYWFYPCLAIYQDISILREYAATGILPNPAFALAFNGLMLGASACFFWRMMPRACPTCGERSLIPLVKLTGQSRRVQQTRWCASCGGLFWRDAARRWRVERRYTWASRHAPNIAVPAPAATESSA